MSPIRISWVLIGLALGFAAAMLAFSPRARAQDRPLTPKELAKHIRSVLSADIRDLDLDGPKPVHGVSIQSDSCDRGFYFIDFSSRKIEARFLIEESEDVSTWNRILPSIAVEAIPYWKKVAPRQQLSLMETYDRLNQAFNFGLKGKPREMDDALAGIKSLCDRI